MAAKMKAIFQVSQHVPSRCFERQVIGTFRTRPFAVPNRSPHYPQVSPVISLSLQNFSTSRILGAERSAATQGVFSHDGSLDRKIGEAKELQKRTPWHREGADQPPVKRLRSAGAMTKGNCYI